MDNGVKDITEQEVYFLIAKLLKGGPCQKAYQALIKELSEHKIIPKRLDWEGEEHEQSFEDLEGKFSHIGPKHLLNICKRVGPLLDKEIKPCVSGIKSLLGSGSQSLLRTKENEKRCLKLVNFVTRRHQCSIYSPINCKQHNIAQALYGREVSGPFSRRHAVTPSLYARSYLLNRTLGHLSAVYCCLFDRTGRYIITGADDFLVKIWSAVDCRLLSTFRGASSEITDIAINIENTLLAAGSLDKVIRVWSLRNAYPVATLVGHTGTITGVSFCPNPFNSTYYLVSTSTDGSVAFWSFTSFNNETKFQAVPLIYYEKVRPGQAQMLCAKFSVGGKFLAAGSADHHVRVYAMDGDIPHRIMEMEKHSDRVDSIQWANKSLTFISGSKDGTAIIWRYIAQNWVTLQLIMSTNLESTNNGDEENKKERLRVTMVSWSADDSYVITAVTDHSLKVWSPVTGTLLRVLKGHKDEVYVLESHPLDARVLLSAGHDGYLNIWDILTSENIYQFPNHLSGQGNCAIFDAKWGPDGTMMAATDSHGHLLMLGICPLPAKFRDLPTELFFHTDYRPLIRDSQHNVLDEQTQVPPHLMPPPFLVDIDGNPYPPTFQRLVPGRENCNFEQLTPNIIISAAGQEVIQEVPEVGSSHSNIGALISRLASRNERSSESQSLQRSRGIRLQGNVEGVRQSRGNWQINDLDWQINVLVTPLSSSVLTTLRNRIELIGSLELSEYQRESKRVAEVSQPTTIAPRKKARARALHSYRTRAAREQQQEDEEHSDDNSPANGDTSDATAHSEDMITSSSEESSSSSSEYSDWVADHGVTLEPPQRSRRKRKPPRKPSPTPALPSPKPVKKAPPPMPQLAVPSSSKEVPELFRPSEWLSEVIPKKFPYYPQMGDEIMFFTQGYEEYIKAVDERKVYKLAESQYKPWGKLNLREPEFVKIIGIKYELRPPRLCCMRLAVIKQGEITSERFTIKYHDIPDVIDFFVLKQTYDLAMERQWKIGDRFRSMIDDGWWWGTIESRQPNSTSPFLCHKIKWDNGESEAMSPWDMEPVDQNREPEPGGSVPVLPEEIVDILYHPRSDEWPGDDQNTYCRRIITGLENVMGLSIAEPFLAPVDTNIYPAYLLVVEFPIDLSTIKNRFENRFYRRVTAAQFDIRYLATNAEKFNGAHSSIVKQARIITDLCLKICKEQIPVDVPTVYRQLLEAYQSSDSNDSEDEVPSTSNRERAAASRSLRALRRSNNENPDWRRDCRQLIDVLWNCQDSEPFRMPVDRLEHPDYDKVIDTPVDLSTIREELRGNNYPSPVEFCKDVRMIFSNSRNYNTNKRSKIYVMTVRLSAMAEEHMKRILQNYRSSLRRRQSRTINQRGSLRKQRTATKVSYRERNASSSDDQEPNRIPLVKNTRLNPSLGESSKVNGVASNKTSSDDSSSSEDNSPQVKKTVSSQSGSSPEPTNSTLLEHNYTIKKPEEDSPSSESDQMNNWTVNGHVKVLRPVHRRLASSESSKENDDYTEDDESVSDDKDESYSCNENVNSSEEEIIPKKSRKRRKKNSDTDYCSESSDAKPVRRSTRKRKPVRKKYKVDESESEEEEEESESEESSSDSSDSDKPRVSISSRGRVRKITARARAFLKD